MIKDNHTHTHTLPEFGPDIPIFTKLYDFYKNLYSQLKLFPKSDRYTLGQKIDATILEIFELLFKIPLLSKDKKAEVVQAISAKIDLLKILLRLGHDNKSIPVKTYLSLQEKLQEIGKMVGGWIKYLQNS